MQETFRNSKNTLYLVATPIGNLGDISYRAVEVLKTVSVVYAEDTRTSKVLFNHYHIETPLFSYFEHNKMSKIKDVLISLEKSDVALISDAGMPGISDPGFELVGAVIDAGYNVSVIPGASASITSLVASGLAMQPHLFIGFLPRKKSQIKEELTKYLKVDATLIFYESPFRVADTLNVMYEVFGNRKVVVARELTKIYETFIRTTLKEAIKMEHIQKGEYVILVEGYQEDITEYSIKELYDLYIKENDDEKAVLKQIAKDLKISKSEVYKEIKTNNK